MPWRVLGVRKAASLPVAETGPAEWLLLKIGGKDVAALLLGISLGAYPGTTGGQQCGWGDRGSGAGDHSHRGGLRGGRRGRRSRRSGDASVDWPQALYKFLRVGSENPPWPQDTIFPHNENEMVRVSPTIFGVDASPDGAGMVSCAVGQAVVQELLRRTDGRGFHTCCRR